MSRKHKSVLGSKPHECPHCHKVRKKFQIYCLQPNFVSIISSFVYFDHFSAFITKETLTNISHGNIHQLTNFRVQLYLTVARNVKSATRSAHHDF
jgi:hypothetical protein